MTLDQIKDFQTIIAASIALCGVVLAMLYNAAEARAQRYRERALAQATLRRAVVAELTMRRQVMQRNVTHLSKNPPQPGQQNILVPTDFGVSIFGHIGDQVGLLTLDEIGPVLFAFAAVDHYPRNVALLGDPATNRNVPGHVTVSAHFAKELSELTCAALELVDDALTLLRAEMGSLEYAR